MISLDCKIKGIPVLSPSEINDWDSYTILQENIESHILMERASFQCSQWIQHKFTKPDTAFVVFCGPGNNGGDGLAISRQLIQSGYTVSTIVVYPERGSRDFLINLQRLYNIDHSIQEWQPNSTINYLENQHTEIVAIDAIFGIGLNKSLDDKFSALINYINENFITIVSIDIPSGLFANEASFLNNQSPIIKAKFTLTFQAYKRALLAPENADYFGETVLLNINLSPAFLRKGNKSPHPVILTEEIIKTIYNPPNKFNHKGKNGHAVIVGGSFGKFGAITLTSKSALHSGAGLISILAPGLAYQLLQNTVPEAMLIVPDEDHISWLQEPQINHFLPLPTNTSAIGIGPGLGTATETKKAFLKFLKTVNKPLIIDADALNIIALENAVHLIPKSSILTPHPKEFERLFGKSNNSFERWEKLTTRAKQYKCTIILKGHFTAIATADGELFFNSTGNAGMAKGGSGDVLTGILTALLAQGYSSSESAILGVYIHGLAADIAISKEFSFESLSALGIIQHLGAAFKRIQSN